MSGSTHLSSDSIRNPTDGYNLLKDIARVALPSLAASLSEPLLSLVDTYYVGKYGSDEDSRNGLAGMMVNMALFNFITAVTNNLMGGTTDVVSKVNGGAKVGVMTEKSQVLGTAIWMAIIAGLLLFIVMLQVGPAVVESMVPMDETVLQIATEYMEVRSYALPATMLNFVIIGFSLGVQEVIAPLALIITSVIVNGVADSFLIPTYGLRGAAMASTMAGYAGCIMGFARLLLVYDVDLLSLGGRGESLDLLAWLSRLRAQMAPFWSTSASIFCGKVADAVTYSAGAYTVGFCGNDYNRTNMIAAHQVVMQTWWFFSFFPSSLMLTSQSFLPKDLAAGDIVHGRALIFTAIRLGLLLSLTMTGLQYMLAVYFPKLFTESDEIASLVLSVLFYTCISQFIIDMCTVLDGIFIGSGRLRHYVAACVLSTCVGWIFFSWSIHNNGGLEGYWMGILAFTTTRMIVYLFTFPSILADTFPLHYEMLGGGANGEYPPLTPPGVFLDMSGMEAHGPHGGQYQVEMAEGGHGQAHSAFAPPDLAQMHAEQQLAQHNQQELLHSDSAGDHMAAAAAAGGEGGGGVSMLAVPQQQTNIYSLMPQEEPIPQSNMEPVVATDPNAMGLRARNASELAVPQQQTNIYSLMPQEEPIPQSNMEPVVATDPNAMGLRARNASESTDEVVLLTDKSDGQEQMGFVTAI